MYRCSDFYETYFESSILHWFRIFLIGTSMKSISSVLLLDKIFQLSV